MHNNEIKLKKLKMLSELGDSEKVLEYKLFLQSLINKDDKYAEMYKNEDLFNIENNSFHKISESFNAIDNEFYIDYVEIYFSLYELVVEVFVNGDTSRDYVAKYSIKFSNDSFLNYKLDPENIGNKLYNYDITFCVDKSINEIKNRIGSNRLSYEYGSFDLIIRLPHLVTGKYVSLNIRYWDFKLKPKFSPVYNNNHIF